MLPECGDAPLLRDPSHICWLSWRGPAWIFCNSGHRCTAVAMYCVNKLMIGRWSEKRIYPQWQCTGLRLARSVWCHLCPSLVSSRRSCKWWPSGVWGAGVHLSGLCSTLLFVAYFLLKNKTSHLFWYLSNLSIHLQYCCFLRETVETLVVKT